MRFPGVFLLPPTTLSTPVEKKTKCNFAYTYTYVYMATRAPPDWLPNGTRRPDQGHLGGAPLVLALDCSL